MAWRKVDKGSGMGNPRVAGIPEGNMWSELKLASMVKREGREQCLSGAGEDDLRKGSRAEPVIGPLGEGR